MNNQFYMVVGIVLIPLFLMICILEITERRDIRRNEEEWEKCQRAIDEAVRLGKYKFPKCKE